MQKLWYNCPAVESKSNKLFTCTAEVSCTQKYYLVDWFPRLPGTAKSSFGLHVHEQACIHNTCTRATRTCHRGTRTRATSPGVWLPIRTKTGVGKFKLKMLRKCGIKRKWLNFLYQSAHGFKKSFTLLSTKFISPALVEQACKEKSLSRRENKQIHCVILS